MAKTGEWRGHRPGVPHDVLGVVRGPDQGRAGAEHCHEQRREQAEGPVAHTTWPRPRWASPGAVAGAADRLWEGHSWLLAGAAGGAANRPKRAREDGVSYGRDSDAPPTTRIFFLRSGWRRAPELWRLVCYTVAGASATKRADDECGILWDRARTRGWGLERKGGPPGVGLWAYT